MQSSQSRAPMMQTRTHQIQNMASPLQQSQVSLPLHMELSSSLLLLLLPFSFFLLLLSTTRKDKKHANLPPCPPTTPFLGPLLWLLASEAHILGTLRRLRPLLGPVLTIPFPSLPVVFVLDRLLAHHSLILRGGVFSDRPPHGAATAVFSSHGHTISSGNGPLWRLLRRNFSSGIAAPTRLRSLAASRQWVCRLLLDELREHAVSADGSVVIIPCLRRMQYRLFARICFGDGVEERAATEIEEVQRELLQIQAKLAVFDVLPRLGKLLFWKTWRKFLGIWRKQEEIMVPLIHARRTATEKSALCYVDTLLDVELPDGGRKLKDGEIVSLCTEVLIAGIDSTSAALEWALANLVKHQHVQQKLYEEIAEVVPHGREISEEDMQRMPYLKAVILETLRRHPPAQFLLPHATSEDASLGGYTIPKGTVVNFLAVEMGWDGDVWKEPLEFRPERFMGGGEGEGVDITGSREMKMMPFGAGRRICPGLGMAMLHLEYYVASLVREFQWKTAMDGEEVDLSEELGFTVTMKKPLRARILPR